MLGLLLAQLDGLIGKDKVWGVNFGMAGSPLGHWLLAAGFWPARVGFVGEIVESNAALLGLASVVFLVK